MVRKQKKRLRDLQTKASLPHRATLGQCSYLGTGFRRITRGVKWVRKAANQNDANAQYNLGGMCFDGNGVPQNYAEGMKWWHKAADQGNANAQRTLGNMYYSGGAVPQDYAEAVKWFQKAADQDDENAQYCLGLAYFNGTGVPKDRPKSIELLRKAAEKGNSHAKELLENISAQGSDVLDGPVTIKPDLTKKPANITLRELIEALNSYLAQVNGLHVQTFDFYAEKDFGTTVYLNNVTGEDGARRDDMNFMIWDKQLQSESGRIGSQPREVMVYTRNKNVACDLYAIPNPTDPLHLRR